MGFWQLKVGLRGPAYRKVPGKVLGKVLGLGLGTLLAGCGSGGADESQSRSYETVLQIDHYKDSCSTITESLCLRARSGDGANWGLMYESIAGLSYEWGHRYQLRLRVTERSGPPMADAPSPYTSYTLLQVLADTPQPASTPFTIKSQRPSLTLEQGADGNWRLNGVALSCSAALCPALASARQGQQPVLLDFDHTSSAQGALHLIAVRPAGG